MASFEWPSDGSGGGGSIAIGTIVTGGDPNTVLYIDAAGKLADDPTSPFDYDGAGTLSTVNLDLSGSLNFSGSGTSAVNFPSGASIMDGDESGYLTMNFGFLSFGSDNGGIQGNGGGAWGPGPGFGSGFSTPGIVMNGYSLEAGGGIDMEGAYIQGAGALQFPGGGALYDNSGSVGVFGGLYLQGYDITDVGSIDLNGNINFLSGMGYINGIAALQFPNGASIYPDGGTGLNLGDSLEINGPLTVGGNILDGSGAPSIDPNNRQLYDSSGAFVSVDYENNVLFSSDLRQTSIDWNQFFLYYASGNLGMNYGLGLTYYDDGGLNESMDFANGFLKSNVNATYSLDWNNRQLLDINGNYELDWSGTVGLNGILLPNDFRVDGVIVDVSDQRSINTGGRLMFGSGGNPSLDWDNRDLVTSSGDNSVSWDNYQLQNLGAVMLDWSNPSGKLILFHNGFTSDAGAIESDGSGNLTVNGLTISAFGTAGILHNDSSGVLSSSLIVDADVDPSAAIAFSKLAALTSAHILVGNGSNVAASVAVSGDAALSNAGAVTLATVNSNVGSFTNASVTVNAKGLVTAASSGASPVPVTQKAIFTSSGTWTKPASVTSTTVVKITVVGGGGAGGAGGTGVVGGSGGGGGGGTSIVWLAGSSLSSTETVTVAGTAAPGNGGGSSSFGSHNSATGGAIGSISTGVTVPGAGGTGGVGSSGDINFSGQSGAPGDNGTTGVAAGAGGTGGTSSMGGGGAGANGQGFNGSNSGNYGGGGGGGGAGGSTGGSGAGGIILLEWIG